MRKIWEELSTAKIIDLSQPMFRGMPQSPNHTPFRMVLDRRHGDVVSANGGSAANEIIVTGAHVGTHIDALAHVSFKGKLFGGVDAQSVMSHMGFSKYGIESVIPFLCRGVFLNIAKTLNKEILDADYEITVSDLEAAEKAAGIEIGEGDVVLIGTGWGKNWDQKELFQGKSFGTPGIGEAGAKWLAAKKPRACGGETIAFEHIPAGAGHRELPVHRVFLVESGIHIIETMKLNELADTGIHEFLFVLTPLNLSGATGSPTRPLAIIV
jgi:kynurenine formamidase